MKIAPPQLSISPGHLKPLPARRHWPETVHVFDEPSIWAVNAALAAGRPLLIRGEPGHARVNRTATQTSQRLVANWRTRTSVGCQLRIRSNHDAMSPARS